jgi:hypothetical protein
VALIIGPAGFIAFAIALCAHIAGCGQVYLHLKQTHTRALFFQAGGIFNSNLAFLGRPRFFGSELVLAIGFCGFSRATIAVESRETCPTS